MKKITLLLLHLQFGGIEKQTITFANELSKKYDVEIISAYSMKTKPAYEVNENIKIKYLIDDAPNRNEFKEAVKNKNLLQIFKEGLKSIKILYLKNHLMIKEIKKLKTDFVFSTRIEYANMLSKYAPKDVITMTEEHLHNDTEKYIKKVKKSFRNLDYLITIGSGSTENYTKWLSENEKIKIVEIPNILEEVPNVEAKLDTYNMVAVGRLHPVKNFPALIEVFNLVQKEIDEATLTIVGGGDELDNLNTLIDDLKLKEKVQITGMVGKEEVQKNMLKSDIYVMTSLTECFPMVLLEASSVGLPLISFDVPVGPKAIIQNGENGYLIEKHSIENSNIKNNNIEISSIENNSIDKMAEKIIELFKNREELKRLGKNAKQSSYQYLPEQVMKKWYEIFDN